MLGSRDRVMIIRGVAGTGKTTLEQEIGEALAEAGKPVVALAQSVKASREVLREEAGFARPIPWRGSSRTRKCRNRPRTASSSSMRPASSARGTCCGCLMSPSNATLRVILVGDRRQHRSVTAGEPLKLLEEKAGLACRARSPKSCASKGDYKKAAQALSEGRTGEAFEELDKLGWIKQVADADRYQQLAAAYLSAAAEKKKDGKPKSALVVSPTHAEAARITLAIRAGLKTQGKLDEERMVHGMDSDASDGRPEIRRDPIRARRPAPVSPECTGPQERIATDCGRWGQDRRPSWPIGSRRTGRRSWPWASATGFASRRAARPRTASTA